MRPTKLLLKKFNNLVNQIYSSDKRSLSLIRWIEKISLSSKQLKEHDKKKEFFLGVYPDTFVSSPEKPTLKVLEEFIDNFHLDDYFSGLHILPFYPWDTDKGYSVLNYYQVKKEYGSWEDIERLAKRFNLMTDLILNHSSIDNPFAQGGLISRHIDKNNPLWEKYFPYQDFLIAFSDEDKPSDVDLARVVRPRIASLLTPYLCLRFPNGEIKAILGDKNRHQAKIIGRGWVWTTFSRPKDKNGLETTRQVDLNYKNPKVLLEILKIIKFYIDKGVSHLRLDAVGIIWKELMTSCVYLEQTHLVIQIIRTFLDIYSPQTKLIVETKRNIETMKSYLSDNHKKEADYVFQYGYFPLYLYSLYKKNDRYLKEWLKATSGLKNKQSIIPYGTHDGLALKTLRWSITSEEMKKFTQFLIDKVGALPNYAKNDFGKQYVSEVCSTPFEYFLRILGNEKEALEKYIDIIKKGEKMGKMIYVYINGLIGAEPYRPLKGLSENREINRETFEIKKIISSLVDTSSQKGKVFKSILDFLSS